MEYRQISITIRAAVADYGSSDGSHQALADSLASRAAGAVRDGVLVADVAVQAEQRPIRVPRSAQDALSYARAYIKSPVTA